MTGLWLGTLGFILVRFSAGGVQLLCVENGPALPKGAVVTELRERTGVTARLARQRHC